MYAIGATLSLAIGTSLAVAVFTVVNTLLWRPLPFPQPDRIGYVYQRAPLADWDFTQTTSRMYDEMSRGALPAFQQIAGWENSWEKLGVRDANNYVGAIRVTPSFFDVVRVRPLLGRAFEANDARATVPPIMLSFAMWSSRYGADSSIIGQEILVTSVRRRVIGVMPRELELFSSGLWMPLNPDRISAEAREKDEHFAYLHAIGRLAPGATWQQASAEAASLYHRLYADDEIRKGRTSRVVSLATYFADGLREGTQLWIAAAILIAILCAVNFATMSMARGMRRRDEIAVRAALGASRFDIARTLLTEATLLAAIGGVLSAWFGWLLLKLAITVFGVTAMPVDPAMDWATLSFGVVVTVIVGFVFAAAPALELAKVDLRMALQGAAVSTTSQRHDLFGRRALVALQLALALTSVAVITALIQSDRRYQARDVGLDYEPMIVASLFGGDSAQLPFSPERQIDRALAVPGVQSVSAVRSQGLILAWGNDSLVETYTYVQRSTPNHFRTIGIPLVAGRLPTDSEMDARDVLLTAHYIARRYFGSAEAAVGKRIRIKEFKQPQRWVTIVGVVQDFNGVWANLSASAFYEPERLLPSKQYTLYIRTKGDAAIVARELSRVLPLVDSRIVVSSVRSLNAVVDEQRQATRGRAIFLSMVAVLAFALAIVGVYGLTSYTTELRLKEFGIRVALGANAPRLARIVFGDLWWMSAIAVVTGVVASGRVVAFLDSFYTNAFSTGRIVTLSVMPTVVSTSTLVLISLLGTIVPLRRVLRMDVMRTVQGSG